MATTSGRALVPAPPPPPAMPLSRQFVPPTSAPQRVLDEAALGDSFMESPTYQGLARPSQGAGSGDPRRPQQQAPGSSTGAPSPPPSPPPSYDQLHSGPPPRASPLGQQQGKQKQQGGPQQRAAPPAPPAGDDNLLLGGVHVPAAAAPSAAPVTDDDLLGFRSAPAAMAAPATSAAMHIEEMFSVPKPTTAGGAASSSRQPPQRPASAAAAAAAPGAAAARPKAKSSPALDSMIGLGAGLPPGDAAEYGDLYADAEVGGHLRRERVLRLRRAFCRPLASAPRMPRASGCALEPADVPTRPPTPGAQSEPADPNEPEVRRRLRQQRVAEKHARMAAQLAEKRARDEAEAAEKAGKVRHVCGGVVRGAQLTCHPPEHLISLVWPLHCRHRLPSQVALRDQLRPKIDAWCSSGKKDNIRALLASLHTVLWEDSGWTPASVADMVDPARVKRLYMKVRWQCLAPLHERACRTISAPAGAERL